LDLGSVNAGALISVYVTNERVVTDPWSIHKLAGDETCRMDLGSVNAPPPLEHRQSGVGWSSERSEREKKLQAASCKRLTAGQG